MKLKRKGSGFIFVLLVTSLLLPTTVLGEKQKSYQIDSITVTADKREKNVQDVSMSIKVFDEFQIDDAGILDLSELTYFTPNVYSQQNVNSNSVIIRGVSSHVATLHPPVGLLVDDINSPLSVMQNTDLLDIQRIEILRGPQGSLYGVNSEAGVIKIITNQPGNELRGKVFGECGVYDIPDDNPV